MAALPQRQIQVSGRSVTYGERYGRNRKERADRLANNRAPANIRLPPIGYVQYGNQWAAYFSEKFRYVEDIFKLSKEEMENRKFVVVRSQKFGEIQRGRRVKTYYFVRFKKDKNLFDSLYGTFSPVSCSCEDTQRCKHIMAVMKKYAKSPLRKLLTDLRF